MNVKRILIIAGIIVIIALVGYFIAIKLIFSGWTDGVIARSEEFRKTSLGDEFLFKYEDRDFPDSERVVDIFDSKGKERITFYVLDDKSLQPSLVTVLDLPQIRCYEIYGQLIYRVGNENFKGIDMDRIAISTLEELPNFSSVAKALVATKDWKWVKACGGFLIKAGDTDAKKTLERYAAGQFTAEELEQNKNSEIKKEDMMDFAKKLLEQK